MKILTSLEIATISLVICAGAAIAEDTGKEEYTNYCASCHGQSAAGDGPLAELLTVQVPSLTGLKAANDGAFPMLNVIHTIDGRQATRGHGQPMPVWGKSFEIQADADGLGAYGGETVVRGRILSIAYYLESIQE